MTGMSGSFNSAELAQIAGQSTAPLASHSTTVSLPSTSASASATSAKASATSSGSAVKTASGSASPSSTASSGARGAGGPGSYNSHELPNRQYKTIIDPARIGQKA